MMSCNILNGDVVQQLKTLPDSSVDLICTDPPYNLGMDDWDKWVSDQEFSQWCFKWATEAHRVLKDDGTIFSFSSNRTYHWMAVALDTAGFKCKDMIEWIYYSTMPRAKNLKSCHEPIYVGVKKKHRGFNVDETRIPFDYQYDVLKGAPKGKHPGRQAYGGNGQAKKYDKALDNKEYKMDERGRHPFNIVECKKPRGAESIKGHQTQKPVQLIKWMIELASNPNDVVLDCFAGTGTTGDACAQLNRQSILIERNAEYCDIIRKRLNV